MKSENIRNKSLLSFQLQSTEFRFLWFENKKSISGFTNSVTGNTYIYIKIDSLLSFDFPIIEQIIHYIHLQTKWMIFEESPFSQISGHLNKKIFINLLF